MKHSKEEKGVITLFHPFDFTWGGGAITVHREVAKRLDPSKFGVYSMHVKRDLKHDLMNTLVDFLPIHIDIIHSPNYPQALLLHLLKRKAKFILTFHGVSFQRRVYYRGKVLSRGADVITTVSKYSADAVKKFFGMDSQVIYNGVDTDFFHPKLKNNDRLKILYTGRLVKWKRPHWVAKLAKKFPDCDFIIHGQGPMETNLKQFANKLTNLEVDSSFLPKEKLRDLYAKSDIFLYPSTDWLPLVTLEAMACGLPLLLHSIGGQSELIHNGREGLLSSTLKGMEENLRYLVEDSEARRKMGRNARENSLRFQWERVAEQYAQLYLELTNQ